MTAAAAFRHADVVDAMRAPRFYGGDAAVEVRETHLSYVFLAGDRAFKLKKPLVLSFADYGSADRRRALCEAEVALNRRLAPATYVGVRSVVARDGGLALGAAGDLRAVEHVVEMRRFSETDTLAARLEAGSVLEVDLEAVGRTIAAFHARASRADAAEGESALARALYGSIDEIERLGSAAQRRRAAALRCFARAFLRTCPRRGAVDGHGDLRAEHVLLHRPLEIVDCIEFDDALRRRDPGSDLAFLLMDLEALGRPDAAAAVLRAYRDADGDAGPDSLLAFYRCERALVRAKVDLIRAAQLGDSGDADALRGRADRLMALARRDSWRARKPLLLVLCGLSGSGKSHLAGAIARASGFEVLSSDVARKRLAGLGPLEHAGEELYTADMNRRTYAELGRAARDGVVVDATFRRAEDRAAFLDALPPDVPDPLYVECGAPRELMRRRLARRPPGPSDATPEVLDSQCFDALDEVPRANRCELRTDGPAEDVLDALEAWLDGRRSRRASPAVELTAT